MTGNDRESRSQRRKSSASDMAAQSQGIKQLMAAEKEAAQVVTNARKSELEVQLALVVLKSSSPARTLQSTLQQW